MTIMFMLNAAVSTSELEMGEKSMQSKFVLFRLQKRGERMCARRERRKESKKQKNRGERVKMRELQVQVWKTEGETKGENKG